MGLLLAALGASCPVIPTADPAAAYLLLQDGGRLLLGDCGGALLLQEQGGGPEPEAETPQPTGGWPISAWQRYKSPEDLRRDREDERRALQITETQQRRLDRVAVKIARRVAREGLNADRPAVMAAPSFDAMLGALRPTEGMILALADAILQRVLWMAAMEQADEEAALMALLAEL